MNEDTSSISEERNAKRFIWSNGLQNIGDQIVAPKTVLTWLFQSTGVPAWMTSLLVPIRESGSMLPQFALGPWVTSKRSRKRVWLIGSYGQATSAAGIAVAAGFLEGPALGLVVLLLMAALAMFRAICSIAGKDVQGRTIEKGHRGMITGRATALGGAFTLAVGLLLFFAREELPNWQIIALLAFGASTWVFAGFVFARIDEPVPDDSEITDNSGEGWGNMWELVKGDRQLQKFLLVRSLMLVTALSTPFIVMLAHDEGANLAGLGGFVVASGGAALIGGRVSGWWSDRSSQSTMAWAAGVASVVIVALVASASFLPSEVNVWIMPVGFFVVNLAHTTVRVARKTYLVDMADGDRRTLITGASNTAMGVILLIVGGISSALAGFGPTVALLFLAAIGFFGVIGAARLKDVSAPAE